MALKTYQERKRKILETISDPDVTLRESYRHLFYWYAFEGSLIMRRRLNKIIIKSANALNDDLDVFEFRKSLKNLEKEL